MANKVVLGVLVCVAVVAGGAWCALSVPAWAQRVESNPTAASGVVALSLVGTDKTPLLAVIDPHARRMAVYAVAENGQISLKSVRNLTWDLSLEQFNAGTPTPDEIRALLPRQ